MDLSQALYQLHGRYDPAVPIALEHKDMVLNLYGETSDEYFDSLAGVAQAYAYLEDYGHVLAFYKLELEAIVRKFRNNMQLLNKDGQYAEVLSRLHIYSVLGEDYERALEYSKSLIPAYGILYGKTSEMYFDALADLFNDLAMLGLYVEARQIVPELHQLSLMYPQSEAAGLFQATAAAIALELNDKDAYQAIDDEDVYSKAMLLNASIAYCISNNENERAEEQLEKALELVPSLGQDRRMRYKAACYNQLGLILTSRNPAAAVDTLRIAESLYTPDNYDLTYAQILNNIGLALYNMGNVNDALDMFQKSLDAHDSLGYSIESLSYQGVYNNIALCRQGLGDYASTIVILNEISEAIKNNYGKKNIYYLTARLNEGKFYYTAGQIDRAIAVFQEIVNIGYEIWNSYDNGIVALALNNLGIVCVSKGLYNDALQILETSAASLNKISGESNYLVYAYINLGVAYFHTRNYKMSQCNFDKANDIIQKCGLQETGLNANLLFNYGRCLTIAGIPDGQKMLGTAVVILDELNLDRSPEFLFTLGQYGLASFIGKNDVWPEYIPHFVQAFRGVYEDNIVGFTESERESFVRYLSPYTSTLFSSRTSDEDNDALYSFLLMSKGLLLGISDNYSRMILESGDEVLVQKFLEIQRLKAALRSAPDDMEVADRIESLERDLISDSRKYADFSKWNSTSSRDIAECIGENEIAVEYVKYKDYKDDKVKYAALIVRKDAQNPVYVALCSETELPDMSQLSAERIYTGAVSWQLYSCLFRPIEQYIRPGWTVSFSSAGIVNTIALESLEMPDGKTIGDIYTMERVSSTKNLCFSQEKRKYSTASVYGGLKYDVSPEVMASLGRAYGQASGSGPLFRSDSTRSGWTYLEGSKIETDAIASLLAEKGIRTNLYQDEKGNEESFKALSNHDVDLIHIATHGFYVPENTNVDKYSFEAISSDPMTRSGLMMSGGNYSWTGQGRIENIEDGVLLAAEIANLNLRHTDLAVLSACETGLGDITEEGVFGLQRGLKSAGVNTVIMSLWKVSDEATVLMMQTFYKNLLKGKTKEESFDRAKAAVRKKYPSPYYWASFIMLD
ncbi:MAG: CHAT domain-containing protein [Bacteroidales bacterium]|nr:CHAT domain-containing protein [Bacteroidales bacterium]